MAIVQETTPMEKQKAFTKGTMRLAAIADVHCGRTSQGALQPLFSQVNESADILLLCGDLTNYGLPEEAQVLARELTTAVKIPVLAVLGNHDYESGKQNEVQQILFDAGINVLDGTPYEILGIGFAGVKGFAGGFGERALQPCGEEIIKRFVHETVSEALKLESALAKLRTSQRVVLLHYSPIRATVEGEPYETFPFLVSSWLEEPLNRYSVTAVFHVHAHRGSLEGRTMGGIPVYNVSMPLLRQAFPERPPFRFVEIRMVSGTEKNM